VQPLPVSLNFVNDSYMSIGLLACLRQTYTGNSDVWLSDINTNTVSNPHDIAHSNMGSYVCRIKR
jgi:hypothetical protein